MDKDFSMWLTNNPSGIDHHDPQQTINDFIEFMDEANEDFKRGFHL